MLIYFLNFRNAREFTNWHQPRGIQVRLFHCRPVRRLFRQVFCRNIRLPSDGSKTTKNTWSTLQTVWNKNRQPKNYPDYSEDTVFKKKYSHRLMYYLFQKAPFSSSVTLPSHNHKSPWSFLIKQLIYAWWLISDQDTLKDHKFIKEF